MPVGCRKKYQSCRSGLLNQNFGQGGRIFCFKKIMQVFFPMNPAMVFPEDFGVSTRTRSTKSPTINPQLGQSSGLRKCPPCDNSNGIQGLLELTKGILRPNSESLHQVVGINDVVHAT